MAAQLTPREQQVYEQLGRGRTYAQMAATMGLADKTIDTYMQHIAAKFGLPCRELRLRAIEERVRAEAIR